MICPQVLTWFREQTLFVRTRTLGHLLCTGRIPEIGCRAAYIMDIALKIRLLRQKLCLLDQRLMASCLDDPPLMEGQGTKAAGSKAAAVTDQAELDLPDSRNTTCRLIGRMVGSHIGKIIDIIHFLLTQWFCRWILYHIDMSLIRLYQTFPGKRICVAVLDKKALCILLFVLLKLRKIRKQLIIVDRVQIFGPVHGSINKRNVFDVDSAVQGICDLYDRVFPHSIGNNICLGIQQNRTF